MAASSLVHPVVVYVVEHHPLELPGGESRFRWLHTENDVENQLQGLLGSYDPNETSVLVDDRPAGPAWRELLGALVEERVRAVVTHLAPLSSAQRQQLIGVCAQAGAQLITPSDAGRNRPPTTRFASL